LVAAAIHHHYCYIHFAKEPSLTNDAAMALQTARTSFEVHLGCTGRPLCQYSQVVIDCDAPEALNLFADANSTIII